MQTALTFLGKLLAVLLLLGAVLAGLVIWDLQALKKSYYYRIDATLVIGEDVHDVAWFSACGRSWKSGYDDLGPILLKPAILPDNAGRVYLVPRKTPCRVPRLNRSIKWLCWFVRSEPMSLNDVNIRICPSKDRARPSLPTIRARDIRLSPQSLGQTQALYDHRYQAGQRLRYATEPGWIAWTGHTHWSRRLDRLPVCDLHRDTVTIRPPATPP